MGNRWISAVGVVLLCLVPAACASPADTPATGPVPGSGSSSSASYDEQEAINRKQAEDATHRLLELASIPPGAVELESAPPALPGPALGTPNLRTYTSLARYWRVPLSFAAVDAYVRAHPPAGFIQEGSSSGNEHGMTHHGYAWAGSAPGSSQTGQLSIGVAGNPADGRVSYLRVDASSQWLDPHPIRDAAAGPRLRIEAGEHCPSDDARMVGVRNQGTGFDQSLVPPGTPTAGLLCGYAGMNGKPYSLLLRRVLSAADAVRVAEAARGVDLGHPDAGPHSCPMSDGAAAVVVLEYPDRPAANLWMKTNGCTSVSNGSITALGGLGVLDDDLDEMSD